jgi:hypothetical protein
VRGDEDGFAENPLRGSWAEVGAAWAELGHSARERRERGRGPSPGKRGEFSLYFFLVFLFLISNSIFKSVLNFV